ncbi:MULTISPECIES: ParB/RepB/Spo0J family partition protein [unclassified Adlercreutzia]|uniref:ParB/RepB/Spo0J family partition protein n=1 Tax=unclassified Adlercreutzia TaxID=2636013 RepID=UPI001F14A428|nr:MULTISPECIES: ParB/RepB/Spo0J family partition protein [unclassified Adlercreutzia]
MAKNTKGGLGRGLNSLLGGTFETSMPATPSPSRERVVVGEENIPSYSSFVEPKLKPSSVPADLPRPAVQREQEKSAEEPLTLRKVLAKKLDEVPIESVVPNPDQPRTNFKKEEIEELANSIEKDGLLQPILVRTIREGKYQIIAGERRWQACKSIGLKTVPVRIKDVDEDRALELALVENVQRSDLNPIEEAYGYKRLMERKNMTQADIAQAMSKGRSTVANALRLLDLPEGAQQLLFEDKITAGHARAILSIPSQEGRQTLTNKLMEMKMSVREAENLARLLSGKPSEGSTTARQPLPKAYKSVAKALREVLNTNVRVKSVKGKNKIEIEFKDEEELERLFEELIASVS